MLLFFLSWWFCSQDDANDYINASLVLESRSGHSYVATQGPLEETAADFWGMVWQQGAPAVVMLCKTRENDMDKCHRYWPDQGESKVSNVVRGAGGSESRNVSN